MNEADCIRAVVTRIGLREFARRAGCSPGAVQRLVKRGVYPVRGPHGPAMRALVDSAMVDGGKAAPVEGAAGGLRLVPAPGWEGLPAKPRRGGGEAAAGDEGESTEAANRRYAIARADLEELRKQAEARKQLEEAGQLIPADVFHGLAAELGKELRQMVERMGRRVEAIAPEAREAVMVEWNAIYPRLAGVIARVEPEGEL